MLSSVEQAFVGRDETQAPQKTSVWEATIHPAQLWIRAILWSFSGHKQFNWLGIYNNSGQGIEQLGTSLVLFFLCL